MLNFEIVNGTTAPVNPKENTIWVKTADKIVQWALDKPTPNYLSDKGVWIETDNSGSVTFNSLKENGLFESLVKTHQWTDAYGWTNKSAYIYSGGQWVQFSTETDVYIMENGVLNPTFLSSFNNGLTITVGTGGDRESGMTDSKTSTANKSINLSEFSGIKVMGTAKAAASSHGGCSSAGTLTLTTSSGEHTLATSFVESGGSQPGTYSQPFEKIITTTFSSSETLKFTVNFDFKRWAGASNGNVEFIITDIYLIKK